VTSLVLLIIAVALIRRFPDVADAQVHIAGILPSMWIAYRRPQLRGQFLQVTEPTIDNLRAMGMVKMKLAEEEPPSISD
jgi:hypothetical protein